MRDHDPIVLEEFNGLWRRGDRETTPRDHFSDCDNVNCIEGGFETRPGVGSYGASNSNGSISNALRHYNYKCPSGESLLVLDASGSIYHSIGNTILYGPILTIPGMTDFGFVGINGRAYITPFHTIYNSLGDPIEVGLENEFVYVYKGDGTPPRKAGGNKPSIWFAKAPFTVTNSSIDGDISKGIHWFAVSFNGGIRGQEIFQNIIAPGNKQATLFNIPIGPPGTVSRTITATKAIEFEDYNPDQSSVQHYVLLVINDNETKSITVNFKDTDLTVPYVEGATLPPVTQGFYGQNSLESGFCDFGLHVFAVVFETDTGFLTAPGPEYFAILTSVDVTRRIDLFNVPVSPDNFVVKRHIIATKAIFNYNGNQEGNQFFFVPEGTIDNNVDVNFSVSFYDKDLLDDASYLFDNFTHISAGVGLTTYKGRMCLWTEKGNEALVRVSHPGEPEAISQVDGLLIFAPITEDPITNAQEYRDILYVTKKSSTIAFSDNGDVPASWQPVVIDNGNGASVHGIGIVLDSGGINIEFLLIANFNGLFQFNGFFSSELTWKIADLWRSYDINDYRNIQIFIDPRKNLIYINVPTGGLLVGNYQNGMTPEKIKWENWSFHFICNTIALVETNVLLIGA